MAFLLLYIVWHLFSFTIYMNGLLQKCNISILTLCSCRITFNKAVPNTCLRALVYVVWCYYVPLWLAHTFFGIDNSLWWETEHAEYLYVGMLSVWFFALVQLTVSSVFWVCCFCWSQCVLIWNSPVNTLLWHVWKLMWGLIDTAFILLWSYLLVLVSICLYYDYIINYNMKMSFFNIVPQVCFVNNPSLTNPFIQLSMNEGMIITFNEMCVNFFFVFICSTWIVSFFCCFVWLFFHETNQTLADDGNMGPDIYLLYNTWVPSTSWWLFTVHTNNLFEFSFPCRPCLNKTPFSFMFYGNEYSINVPWGCFTRNYTQSNGDILWVQVFMFILPFVFSFVWILIYEWFN